MWQQRSHTDWLKGGDQISRYFHCRSNKRNKRNFILGFEDDNGVWTEDEGRMGELVEEYFSNLFSTFNPSGFDEILEGISPTVTDDMNTSLNCEYTAAEVVQALHQMAPLTAPSPDGMSLIFYKSFQHIVGGDITNVVLVALNSGIILDSINTTFISLISKIQNLKQILGQSACVMCFINLYQKFWLTA